MQGNFNENYIIQCTSYWQLILAVLTVLTDFGLFFKFKDVYGVWSVFLFQQLFTIILMYPRQKTLSYVCVIV